MLHALVTSGVSAVDYRRVPSFSDECYAGPLTFEFYRFRFHFRSAGTLYFPVYKSGNIVRGAFGGIFRKLVCIPSCHDAKTCDIRADCPYARVFEPQAARGEGPSGLADWPRPFVFRAAHLDGRTIPQGEAFHFDVHVFDVRDPALPYFVLAFAQLAREGLGPGRGRAELTSVDQLDLNGARVAQVFDGEQFQMRELAAPNVVDLSETPERVDRVRVRFVTPTELKSWAQIGGPAEFRHSVREATRPNQHAARALWRRFAGDRFPRDGRARRRRADDAVRVAADRGGPALIEDRPAASAGRIRGGGGVRRRVGGVYALLAVG